MLAILIPANHLPLALTLSRFARTEYSLEVTLDQQ